MVLWYDFDIHKAWNETCKLVPTTDYSNRCTSGLKPQ